MSWREDYQPGSFRGVPFVTEQHERSGGRRVHIHEFPQRDEPVAEDLGRRARQFQIDCFVVGDDYYPDRDALIDALEAEGPATLIHPWHGTHYVSVMDYAQGEDQAGGYAWFSVTFVEAGASPSLAAGADTAALARMEADAIVSEAPEMFAGRYSLAGMPAFVEDAADMLVGGVSSVSQIAAGFSGGASSALRAFDVGLRLLGAESLLRTPLALGHAIVGLVSTVAVLGGTARSRTAALRTIAVHPETFEPVPGATPARHRQRENQAAIAHLVRAAASAEIVKAISLTSFASYEEAVATRTSFGDLFDGWSLAAADAGDDERAATFDRLRVALIQDVTARGGTLQRVYAVSLGATEPAIVIAQRLYGTVGDLEARAADIVARNRVRHPGFVPGGGEIAVLTHG